MKPILDPPNVIISNCSLLKEENPRQMLSHFGILGQWTYTETLLSKRGCTLS